MAEAPTVESAPSLLGEGLTAAEWLALPETPEWWAQQMARNAAAAQLLRSWREVDAEEAQEQRETWEYLQRVLDEDRLSDRKLFPCDES